MIVGILGFVAAVLFFWTAWRYDVVWGFDSEYYFQAAIVLALVGFGARSCRCCCRDMGAGKCGEKECGHCNVGGAMGSGE